MFVTSKTTPDRMDGPFCAAGDVGLGEAGLNGRFSLSHADNKTTALVTMDRRLIEPHKVRRNWAADVRISEFMFSLCTRSVMAAPDLETERKR
jgi:hypothetical protein